MSAIPATAAPPDPIFALMGRYNADSHPKKTDLGIGAYRDNNGKPWVLPVVRKVDELLAADPKINHEYQPIQGNVHFLAEAARLLFGADADLSKIASAQTLSGTGANHMGALLLSRFPAFGLNSKKIWVPTPTWGNHHQIFSWAGLEVKPHPYWDGQKRELAFEGMIQKLDSEAAAGDVLLLHACAHNPTGMDPTRDQWKEIAALVKRKNLFVFFDSAYQGFASGSLDNDAWSVRYFVDQKIDLLVCQSFSKNMGLYGERCGALHIVLNNATPETVQALVSQISTQTRAEVSTTPAYGSRIADKILTTPELFDQWKREVKLMADRIIEMRHHLRSRIEALNTPGTWSHITEQIGMFSFTGLTEKQARKMVDDFHVYMLPNGRISMAGLNESNVDYVAESIHNAVVDDQGHL